MQTQSKGRHTAKTAYFQRRADSARIQLEKVEAQLARDRAFNAGLKTPSREVVDRIAFNERKRRELQRMVRNSLFHT